MEIDKHPVSLPVGKYIEPAPKGSEKIYDPDRCAKPYRRDPTEYKSEYEGSNIIAGKPQAAGLPKLLTPIGDF